MYNKEETVANPNQIEVHQTSPLELINHKSLEPPRVLNFTSIGCLSMAMEKMLKS